MEKIWWNGKYRGQTNQVGNLGGPRSSPAHFPLHLLHVTAPKYTPSCLLPTMMTAVKVVGDLGWWSWRSPLAPNYREGEEKDGCWKFSFSLFTAVIWWNDRIASSNVVHVNDILLGSECMKIEKYDGELNKALI